MPPKPKNLKSLADLKDVQRSLAEQREREAAEAAARAAAQQKRAADQDLFARAIGLDVELFIHRPAGVSDAAAEAYVRPLVEKAAFALSANEAWALLAGLALLGLLLVPFAGAPPQNTDACPNLNNGARDNST